MSSPDPNAFDECYGRTMSLDGDVEYLKIMERESLGHHGPMLMAPEFKDRFLQLARLGLWAEQHGIPALKGIWGNDHCVYAGDEHCAADDALVNLPKELK